MKLVIVMCYVLANGSHTCRTHWHYAAGFATQQRCAQAAHQLAETYQRRARRSGARARMKYFRCHRIARLYRR